MTERFGGVPDGYLQRVENTLAGGESALRALFELPEPPTAVSTSTDLVAIGVLHAAHMIGASVPDRLSVVGFDDILIAAHTVPALTTLRMPIAEMVREAVGTAIELARRSGAPRPEPTKEVFEPRLVVRRLDGGAARLTVSRGRSCRLDSPAGAAGIQTRIASTLRLAQAKYGIARSSIDCDSDLVPCRPDAGRHRQTDRSRGRGPHGPSSAGRTVGSTSTSSSSRPPGRSAVSMQ